MKRYITLILMSILALGMVGVLFYLLLRQDGTSYVTYIKFQVNPSFVIGINKNENVVFYNALNTDAGKYNLSMFQGKKIDEATKVFIEKFGKVKDNKDTISITVMTKNTDLENHIAKLIRDEILKYDSNYQFNLIEASREELERYSNEIRYNLPRSYSNDKLKEISKIIFDKVNNYVTQRLNTIKMNKLLNEAIMNLLKGYSEKNYFTDYDLFSINLNMDNAVLGKKSNYEVNFSFDEDNKLIYKITLNLELNYKNVGNEETTIETYDYQYEVFDDLETISNLKTYFYVY